MKLLFIFGTRPEAIKMAPVILEFKKHPEFDVKVCNVGQHRSMVDQVRFFFEITPDYTFDLMKKDQSLEHITISVLQGLHDIFEKDRPDLIFVQGDTTTAFAGALAGFYNKIPVAHIEAGLRSKDKYSPYPEEGNRILIDHLATYLFAPTDLAVANLLSEGITRNVWPVGNTGIDALMYASAKINAYEEFYANRIKLNFTKKTVLITAHRRESFGEPIKNICAAIKHLAQQFPDVNFVYSVHLNPNIYKPVYDTLIDEGNVVLLPPLDYPEFVWLMKQSYIIMTDSGGIQEEAPYLKKPVVVMRDTTERMEGFKSGCAVIVGTETKDIIDTVYSLLSDENHYKAMVSNGDMIYGAGDTSSKIVEIIKQEFPL